MEWTKETPTKPGFYWIVTKNWVANPRALRGGFVDIIDVWDIEAGRGYGPHGTILFQNVAIWLGPIQQPELPDNWVWDDSLRLWIEM